MHNARWVIWVLRRRAEGRGREVGCASHAES